MKSLTRKQFLDLTWDTKDLDAVAEFWLRLYERAAQKRGFSATPNHSLEIRLTGFPRHEGEKLRAEIERRAAESDIVDATVERRDPDTLVLSTCESSGENSPPTGLGLPLLADPTFEGLVVELRFQATGREGWLLRIGRASSTLVLIGELTNGALLLKALWRRGKSGWEDKNYLSQVSSDQNPFLAGFEEFRKSGKVRLGLAKRLFKPSIEDRNAGLNLRLGYAQPDGRPRLPRLLFRLAVFAALLAPFAWMMSRIIEDEEWGWLVPILAFGWYPLFLFALFVYIEYRLWFTAYRLFRSMYDRYFEEGGFVVLPLHDVTAKCDDPFICKFTDELRVAGFTQLGDVAVGSPTNIGMVYRVFFAPDGMTYLTLVCLSHVELNSSSYHYWPRTVRFYAQTFFINGGRVDSVGDAGTEHGYWNPPLGPCNLVRLLHRVSDPIQFLQQHAEAAEAFAGELGLTVLRHAKFEEYVRRQEAIQDEQRRHYLDHPYSWGNHLRWYLQLPRKEMRGES